MEQEGESVNKKTGICNRCGKNIEESKHELYINASDKYGTIVVRKKLVLCDNCTMKFARFLLDGSMERE